MPHLQTLTEFELANGHHRYGLLGFDNRPYLIWFYRRWQVRINEVLRLLKTDPPPLPTQKHSRPCAVPADFRPWGTPCKERWPYAPWFNNHPGWRLRNPFEPSVYSPDKNFHTYRGFPKDHTLARLPRPLIHPQGWSRSFVLVAPWEAEFAEHRPVLTLNDPNEGRIRAELFEQWHRPKSRNTGGKKQKRALYRWVLQQPPGPLAKLDDRELVAALTEGSGDAQGELFRRFYPGLYRFLLGQGHARQAIDAEDITALTFDDVTKDIEKFVWKSKLGTWIYAIAKNQATKFYTLDRQSATLYGYNNPNAVPYDETDDTREVHSTAKKGSWVDPDNDGEGQWQFAEDSDEEAQKNASGPKSLVPDYRGCRRPGPEQPCLFAEKRQMIAKYLRKMTGTEQLIIRYRYFDGRIDGNKYKDGLTFKEIGALLLKSEKAVEVAHRRAIDELFVFLKFDPYFADRIVDPRPPSDRKPGPPIEQLRPAQPKQSPEPVLAS